MKRRIILAASSLWCLAVGDAGADEMQVFLGHLHNHSNVSDGRGTPVQAYAYARDVAKLDFLALADHAEQISASEWNLTKAAADSANRDSSFTALWGFEWSSPLYGHVTVVNTPDYCTSVQTATNTFAKLATWVDQNSGIAFFNHPGREDDLGQEFQHFATPPSARFVGMELWNKNDGFSRYYYNDGYFRNDSGRGHFDEALMRGWYRGAAGADDNHDATWGTRNQYRMAIWARANTRKEIVDALLARRFYSTLDSNLILSFEASGLAMGSSIPPGTHAIRVSAADRHGEVFTQVTLLRNGIVDETWSLSSATPVVEATRQMRDCEYWYCRVRQSDGHEAISSPLFVKAQATAVQAMTERAPGSRSANPYLLYGRSPADFGIRLYTPHGRSVASGSRGAVSERIRLLVAVPGSR